MEVSGRAEGLLACVKRYLQSILFLSVWPDIPLQIQNNIRPVFNSVGLSAKEQ